VCKSFTRVVVISASLGLLAATFHGQTTAPVNKQVFTEQRQPSSQARVSSLSPEARAAISGALGRGLPGFEARRVDGATAVRYQTEDPTRKLSVVFTTDGVRVRTATATLSMKLAGYGRGTSLTSAAAAVPTAAGNRVEYRRGALTEWYINGPLGLEQGFTIARCPSFSLSGRSQRAEDLTVALALHGNMKASLDRNGTVLTLTDERSRSELHYAGLAAFDAYQRRLPARLELEGQRLLLKVNDAAARYPVVIDPIVELASIQGRLNLDAFGNSMAINGRTLAVGAPTYPVNAYSPGRVFVYVEPPGGWTSDMNPTAALAPSGKYSSAFLGSSVAIAGNTIAATANGQVYLYVEPAGGWKNMTESAILSSSDGSGFQSVAMTGNTVTGGAPSATVGSNANQGAAYVWVKPAGGWTNMTETAKLTASDGQANDELGWALAMSGNTIVAGAPFATVGSNAFQGAGYLFVRPATGWTSGTETAKLTAADPAANQYLGETAALDASTALIGAPAETINGNVAQGAAYIFVAPPTGWVSKASTAKLTASDGAEYDGFGEAVSINGDTIAIGATDATVNDVNEGAAYLFAKPQGGWKSTSAFNDKLTPADLWNEAAFGASTLVSNGAALVAAPGANYEIGEVYVFGTPQ
jgi:trimeric autotransporter adhesin